MTLQEQPIDARVVAPPARRPVEPLRFPPSISVIVPAYEAASTIGETLASVFAQTVAAHEVVVADDGSTDNIEEALEPFRSRLRLVRGSHAGVARARNNGVRVCSGDFVLVLDADDVLLPGKLEALSRLARLRPDLDLLCTDVFFEANGRRAGRFGEANPFAVDDQRRAILEHCFVGWPAVRRSRLLDAGGFDESLSTAVDWDCWIRLLLDGALAGLHDEPLAVYRLRPGSLTAARSRTLRDRVRMMEKARDHPGLRPHERPVLERAIKAHRARAVLAEATEAVAGGRPDARRRCLEVAGTAGIGPADRLRALIAGALPPRARAVALPHAGARSPLTRAAPVAAPEERSV